MPYPTIFETDIKSLPFRYRGKVRDIYDIDEQHMLIIASDRLSAFDVVLPTPIPEKGVLLTEISDFWFEKFSGLVNDQRTDLKLKDVLPDPAERQQAEGRAAIVKKLKALPVEAIVRGYIIGSGWKDYQATGSLCGIELPKDLRLADKLPEPIFTPSTKAAAGNHDENISFAEARASIGQDMAEQVRAISLDLYTRAADYARERGIIIADTKFEFGLDENNELVLIDEVLTPDSSRFWPADQWQPGKNQASYDKQFVRDYLETLDWNKTAPGPELPTEIVERTAVKYRQAVTLLTET